MVYQGSIVIDCYFGLFTIFSVHYGVGQGMLKNSAHPRLLSGAGRGKGPAARVFWGPIHSVTNSNYFSYLYGKFKIGKDYKSTFISPESS